MADKKQFTAKKYYNKQVTKQVIMSRKCFKNQMITASSEEDLVSIMS